VPYEIFISIYDQVRSEMQIVELSCPDCSQKIVISNPHRRVGEVFTCGCGSTLRLMKGSNPEIAPEVLALVGTLLGVLLGWGVTIGTVRLVLR